MVTDTSISNTHEDNLRGSGTSTVETSRPARARSGMSDGNLNQTGLSASAELIQMVARRRVKPEQWVPIHAQRSCAEQQPLGEHAGNHLLNAIASNTEFPNPVVTVTPEM